MSTDAPAQPAQVRTCGLCKTVGTFRVHLVEVDQEKVEVGRCMICDTTECAACQGRTKDPEATECKHCKKDIALTESDLDALRAGLDAAPTYMRQEAA